MTVQLGDAGCTIFVKLHQFDRADATPVVIDTQATEAQPPEVPGFEATLLHQFGNERVSLVRWGPDTPWKTHAHDGGEEVFVIKGCFSDANGAYPAGTWLRYPHGSTHDASTLEVGAILYVKSGHLPAGA